MTEIPDHDTDPQEPDPPRPDLGSDSQSNMPTETPAAEEPAAFDEELPEAPH